MEQRESQPSSTGQSSRVLAEQEATALAREVFTFAYPLVLMDATRVAMSRAPQLHGFSHVRAFPDPSFTDVVSPNADTLYSSAWIDLADGPMILSVPETTGRYYLIPMLDAWTNVFASIGTRTHGGAPGRFAIVGPGYRGTLPADVARVDAPTDMIWLIGRTAARGAADFPNVHAIQDGYQLTPLGARAPKTPPEATNVAPVDQIARMTGAEFFGRFAELLVANPLARDDAPMLEKLAKLGIAAGQPFRARGLERALDDGAKQALAETVRGATSPSKDAKNGWATDLALGRYGNDYDRRAQIAWKGLGANAPEDAVYPVALVDSTGRRFSGTHRYIMHFGPNELPPVKGFWSLTMYNDRQFFVPNPIDRYAIGDRDPLQRNPDGSIDILIQESSPGKEHESNWLPSPGGSFNLILRMYWPGDEVLSGRWNPPGVVVLD